MPTETIYFNSQDYIDLHAIEGENISKKISYLIRSYKAQRGK
jgi:hypothetical protein